ncbi:MAG: hypothetical protein IT531_00120 [Burkholderiales bacterium]|nr:hypothetical protein [Burkholderiales bacterium]
MSAPIADLQIPAAIASVIASAGALTVDASVYWLGVPMPVVLAGFAGSACALSFLGSLTRLRALSIVACCTLIAAYLQPLIGYLAGWPMGVWPGAAFFVGLIAHALGTAIFGAAPGAVRDAFGALIDRIRGRP